MGARAEYAHKKVPLKWRLKAWWEGYDVADIEEKMRLRALAKKPQKTETAPDAEVEKALWDSARVKISQIIWGDGFCGPGGPQNVINMSKLLALSPKMSALVVGAGLGGPARVLAQEFGVWINGYESNELLAKEGMNMTLAKGLGKKAPIIHLDLNVAPEFDLQFDRQFDRCYAKESLFTVENKAGLIKSIYNCLKDDSLFLISDYVINSLDSLTRPDMIDWIQHEPHDPYPVTSEKMIEILEKAGFQVRIKEDTTDYYLGLIGDAWANPDGLARQMAEGGEPNPKELQAMMKETDLWKRRTKIMRKGQLKVFRYLAHKPVSVGKVTR